MRNRVAAAVLCAVLLGRGDTETTLRILEALAGHARDNDIRAVAIVARRMVELEG